ncbi:MAG: tetratricopeptide repeat protein [Thermomicrobiales bacterium]
MGDPPDDGHYRGALASWLSLAGRYAEAREEALRVVSGETATATPGAGTSFAANAWRGLASTHAALGRVEEAHRAYERAMAAYRAVGHWYQVGNTRAIELYEVALPYRADDPAGLRRLADDAAEAWARASDVLTDLPLRVAHLPVFLLEGRWDEARELALAVREPGGRTQWRPFATTHLAHLARDRGEADLAWMLVRERLPEGPTAEPGDAIFLDATPLQRLAAALALDAGDLPLARAWLEAHDRWLAWSDADPRAGGGVRALVALPSRGGRSGGGAEAGERALAQATEPRCSRSARRPPVARRA